MLRRSFLSLVPALAAWPSVGRAGSFREAQRNAPRVKPLWAAAESRIKAKFAAAKVAWPPKQLVFRAFKADDAFELWASGSRTGALAHVHTFAITGRSGDPGPKRRQGDGQVPEGVYRITGFNPASDFHLSLRVGYPNASDLKRKTASDAGGDIMIHGKNVTIGCIPLGDEAIEEVYVAAVEAHHHGGPLEAQLFPARLDDAATFTKLVADHPVHAAFWANLRTGLEVFARTKRPLKPVVDAAGDYVFKEN